jgi:protein O-mannosyl-transferase
MKKTQKNKAPVKKSIVVKKVDNKKNYFNPIATIIIVLLGSIVYSNSFNCAFQFDDLPNIVNNPALHSLKDVHAWWNFVPTRPLGNLTFVLNYHFNQLDVRYYHFVNLLIHLINACLIAWFTLLIFSSPSMKGHKIIEYKKYLALFTALLFVSHPLATQSVTYIVQRLASMAAMFYFFSIILYMKARLSDKGIITKYLLYCGCLISGLLGILTKENAYTLPFAILMVEFFFLRKKKLSIDLKDYRLYLFIAGFIGIIVIILLKFSLKIFNSIPPEQGNTFTVTAFSYLLTQFSVMLKYIQLLILPINQNLDYDYAISTGFFEIRTLFSFIILLGLIILAIFLYKKHRMISFGIFWFFLTLSVEASFIPIPNLIFEHRTYLPSFGFFLILSSVIYILLWKKYKYLAVSILIIIIISNSFMTYERNKIWKDDLSLWSDVVSKSPNKARPIVNLALAYANRGQINVALTDNSKAIKVSPNYSLAYYNRGLNYKELGKWDKSIADLSKAIQIDPKYVDAYFNRGVVYGSLGKWDKAIADYSMGIKIDPKNADLYSSRGIAYGNMGQWDKSIAEYSRAIEIELLNADAYSNRGAAYSNLGQWDKAIIDFTKAIEINPKHDAAYQNRGFAYSMLGQWDKTIYDYSKVLEIDPNNNDVYTQREIAYKKLAEGTGQN